MKAEWNKEKTDVYSCIRCRKNIGSIINIDKDFIGCPRGSCDAVKIGELVIKTKFKFTNNEDSDNG